MPPLFETTRLSFDPAWPESWRISHHHDDVEIWGGRSNPPYAAAYHQRMREVLAAVQRHTPAGGRLLDLAAAQGNYTLATSAMGYRSTWNDLRGELIDYVRLKSPQAAELEFVAGNILDLDSGFGGSFDTVLALEVIEHVAHPDAFLMALAQLLRPGGRLIVSTPNGGYFGNGLPRFSDFEDPSIFEADQFKPDDDGHIFLLHEDEMRSLATAAGLEVVEHRTFTNPLTAGFMGLRRVHMAMPGAIIGMVEGMTRQLPALVARKLNVASLTVLRHQGK